ncbi:MAG: RnfABCDGE type electron transport complex subunit A [Candidatus Abyssobacteria bacterium SURF_5]|uniref:Ion-translocating oxidoreductase complex subunit A n=1 Tax=Abyssobacteria bacterium (strain SURF_5) TaxID=2093360 RepID=A0A3A4NQM8_ABYX5|nr:MAG: RnfABCDGE type electron transport complex subunit A [Candidatus Abyssubacteria bacterium SURF_5]
MNDFPSISTLMTIAIGAIFINNFVLSRFLGICPFIGVSRSIAPSVGMGMAVIFVMTLAGFVTFYVNYLLVLAGVGFLQTVAFILVIAALVQFVEMFLQKFNPTLYSALGIYLPLITTNCAVLGVALLNIKEGYSIIEVLVFSFSAAIGFALALVIMAGIRERLEITDVPKAMEGAPIAFIVGGILSLAFMGFSGMKF